MWHQEYLVSGYINFPTYEVSHFIFQSWVFQILLSCDVLKCWLINHFSVQKRRSNSIIFFCIKRREENWICHNPYTKLFVGRIENHFMLEWYLKYLNEKLFINCRRFSVFLSYLSEIMRGFPIYSLVYKHWKFTLKIQLLRSQDCPKFIWQNVHFSFFFSSFAKSGAVWRLVCVLERHQISEISLCRDFAQYATSQMTPPRIISLKSINFYLL